MPGDYSRNTHDPAKHYTRVLIQEGRVQLDSDSNEASADLLHRITAETIDVIGETGAPKYGGGFAVAATGDQSDLTLSPGHIYVHGILAENGGDSVTVQVTAGDTEIAMPRLILDGQRIEKDQWLQIGAQLTKVTNVTLADPTKPPALSKITIADAVAKTEKASIRRAVSFLTQPFASPEVPADGTYSVYLKVWEREVSALEDPDLREIALGGPDTARRQQTVWQVALRALDGDATCENAASSLASTFKPPTGLLAARAVPDDGTTDLCLLPPTAGYRGLENNLYRVEIHRAGSLPNADATKRPTFKWARSNASLEVSVENVNVKDVKVRELGKDDLFRFEPNDWVELVDDASRRGDPHPLVQIDTIDAAKRLIKLKTNPPATSGANIVLRRWNQDGTAAADAVAIADSDWIDLQLGVQVRFADGDYHAGDYWEIPARTAIHDVLWPRYDDATPELVPPRGVPRYYTPLAVVQVTGKKFDRVTDCRTLFPPLTHICADDVCFDNRNCKLPGATTVQQALDELCARDDFDFYKKHLFGYGVVCGLQLGCTGPKNSSVLVKSGYAIDCEGRDIKVRKDTVVDLTRLPEWEQVKDEDEVCLSVERGNGEPKFHLSKKKKKKNILEGTALMEAYEECFQKIAEYFAKNFQPDTKPGAPVSESQKRLTSAWNLMVQLYNPTSGRRVWISKDEHNILETIYKELTELLKISNTYCALSGVPDFPKYPFDAPPAKTWFGKSEHKKLRIAAKGERAFLFGANERIDVFDRAANAMLDQLEFPNKTTITDVGPSNDGARLYVLAGQSFATYDFAAKKWSAVSTLKEKVAMLAVNNGAVELYAAGEKGLFSINPATGAMQLRNDAGTSGHIAIDQRARAVVVSARRDSTLPFGTYDSVRVHRIASDGDLPQENFFPLPQTGTDGVAISSDGDGRQLDVYAVFDAGATKHVLAVTRDENPFDINLGVDADIAIHGVPNQKFPMAAVTFAEPYQLRFITAPEGKGRDLDAKVVPTQICASAVAVHTDGRVYVANHASHTITFYDPKVIVDPKPVDHDVLKNYREAAFDAFKDLFVLLAESLKDCVCDHLLIDCPTCTEEDIVYLGCLVLERGRVRRICPIEQRQFVLSPRLVSYWMSFVPVFPFVRAVVEWFCCLDLPQLMADKIPIPKDGEDDTKKCAAMPNFSGFSKASISAPFREAWSSTLQRAPFLVDLFKEKDTAEPKFKANEIANQSVPNATAKLENIGVSVAGVEKFDPEKSFTHFRRALTDLKPGQSVVLVERDGKVAYAHDRVITAAPSTDATALAGADERDRTIRALTEKVGKLEEELTAAKKFREDAETRISALHKRAESIDELKEAVAKLQRRPPTG